MLVYILIGIVFALCVFNYLYTKVNIECLEHQGVRRKLSNTRDDLNALFHFFRDDIVRELDKVRKVDYPEAECLRIDDGEVVFYSENGFYQYLSVYSALYRLEEIRKVERSALCGKGSK